MCVNYRPSSRQELIESFGVHIDDNLTWPDEVYQDYPAPIIRTGDDGRREAIVATFGMVPKQHIPPGVKHFSTMNSRSESVGKLRSYALAWRAGQLCLCPTITIYEPNWETGSHVRWGIGMADGSPFAVAGLWRAWHDDDGAVSHSFTQLTINADDHPLMRRFHRPGTEKRSLVIVPPEDYDAWLACRDPELARSFLRPFPAELMTARPEPKALRTEGVRAD